MAVRNGFVVVRVRVGLAAVPRKTVLVTVVLVVGMRVRVGECLVPVQVPVALGQMQSNAARD
jgi:hypothetical protein